MVVFFFIYLYFYKAQDDMYIIKTIQKASEVWNTTWTGDSRLQEMLQPKPKPLILTQNNGEKR